MSHLGSLLITHEKCDHCNQKYEIEPGFFYGSMYVSYALAIAFSGITFGFFVIAQFLLYEKVHTFFDAMKNMNIVSFVVTNIFVLILLLPYISRTARVLWLSLFIKK